MASSCKEEVNVTDHDDVVQFIQEKERTDAPISPDVTTEGGHMSKSKAPDGGWGWMVVLGAFIGHLFVVGLARSSGVIYVALLERYDSPATLTALVISLYNTFRMLLGPLASIAADSFTCRVCLIVGSLMTSAGFILSAQATELYHLHLSYGVFAGISASFTFAPMYIIIGQYFDKHKGKAMGIATVGSGVGALFLSPLIAFLLEKYSLFGTYLMMGALILHCAVAGALFRPLPSRSNKRDDPGPHISTKPNTKSETPPSLRKRLALLKNPTFLLFGTNMIAVPFCVGGPLLFLPALGQEKGASATQASFLLAIAGISDVIGRFINGPIFDMKCLRHRRRLPHSIVGIATGVVLFSWGLMPNYYLLAAVVALWGLFEGGFHGQKATVLSEFVPKEQLSFAVGMGICFQGAGSLLAPISAAFISEKFGSYAVCYYYFGAVMVVLCTLFLLEYFVCRSCRAKRHEPKNQIV